MRTRKATAAASRYGGRGSESGSRLRHTLAALEMRDGTREQIAHLLRRKVAVQQPVAGDGNRRRLLRDAEHGRIGLLRQPQRRAVARAERFVGDLELRERQHSAGADDLVAADQARAFL